MARFPGSGSFKQQQGVRAVLHFRVGFGELCVLSPCRLHASQTGGVATLAQTIWIQLNVLRSKDQPRTNLRS